MNNKFIHYGDFYINSNISFTNFLNIISNPSNVLHKITIVDGWSKNKFKMELSKIFDDYFDINYDTILADTYFYNKDETFFNFINRIKEFKNNYLKNKKDNIFFESFNEKDLLIIGSLIDKEGLDYKDKKLISSVILNRLNKNMRLQIDATVLYSITEGNYELNRPLTRLISHIL